MLIKSLSIFVVKIRIGLFNIHSQKTVYENTTKMVQDLAVGATLIYKPSPEYISHLM